MGISAALSEYVVDLAVELRSRHRPDLGQTSLVYQAPMIVASGMSLTRRKARGIFFTHPSTAARLAERIMDELKRGHRVLDPALGAGDLLLASAVHLPRGRTVDETLRLWSQLLRGFERESVFLDIARLRLALIAKALHGSAKPLDPERVLSLFPLLQHGDFLRTQIEGLDSQTCAITNPPYNRIRAPSGEGRRITAAAVFFEKLYRELPVGSHIVGLFPEVLRCGSSYVDVRGLAAAHVTLLHHESLGRFSRAADIDVFIGHYRLEATSSTKLEPAVPTVVPVLEDYFQVTTGPVVPHRATGRGKWTKFLSTKDVPAWDPAFRPTANRRHNGPTHKPPFVVVRRTSSPTQRFRAVGTVIVGHEPMAVENHLLVLTPLNGGVATCRELIRALKSTEVNDQLNSVMRCRHLTVGSLRSLKVKL
jgi:urease gamma subunit